MAKESIDQQHIAPMPSAADLFALLGPKEQREIFSTLTVAWKRDTIFNSSATKILEHPAYQLIIQLGTSIVPLIINDLRNRNNHWYYALRILTGINPPENACQNMHTVRRFWLQWAKVNMI